MKEEPHKHTSSEAQHTEQVQLMKANLKRLKSEFQTYKLLENNTMRMAIAKKIKQAEAQMVQKLRETPPVDREIDDFVNQWEHTDAWRNQ